MERRSVVFSVLSSIALIMALLSSGAAVLQVFEFFRPKVDIQEDAERQAIVSMRAFERRLTSVEGEVRRVASATANVPPESVLSAQVAALSAKTDGIQRDVARLRATLLENPEDAVTVLRLADKLERTDASIQAVDLRVNRSEESFRWIVGTLALGMFGTLAVALLQIFRKT